MTPEPAEHARYRGYLEALSQAAGPDESSVIAAVLGDPDQVMAEAAVLRHLDLRAARLDDDAAFTAWSRQVATAIHGRELLERRLREWSLSADIDAGRPWSTADLGEASNWLQLRTAEHSRSHRALTVLACQGRTRRIRSAAHERLDRADEPLARRSTQ
ncbi:hypothetical protein ABH926_005717 [Catenulispora sp. GP43]|uniref:hypothetical protein n=1 Tax=Catenulispora sp. GP43 TaxID=3156263 RepID=UPI0035119A74